VADADEIRHDTGTDSDGEPSGRTVTREVSLDEAISMAILFLKEEQAEDADKLLGAALQVAPDHPVALHFAGVTAHRQKRYDEGIALIERSLEADPSQADWHSNLGIVLKAAGRLDDAIAAYGRAIALEPGHARAHNNLGVLQKMRGLASESEASYREAIRLDPEYADAYHNLGSLLSSLRRVPEAVAAFNKALVLSPAAPETRRLLALAHCSLGEPEKAVRIFDEWLREEPDNPVAMHMRAACSGESVPARASDAYIQKAFDGFAASFDTKLARLAYQAPQLVAATLSDTGAPPERGLDVLDAGCGTGLCGPLLKPYARRLVGVDLSSQMLALAEKRAVYDEVCQAELTGYLAAHPASFDVVASADTLVYFGALDEVAAAAAAALRPGGWLIFTVEASEGDAVAPGYELRYHGRYVHSRGYLEATLGRAGFRTDIVQAELRMEAGLPVAGFVVRATAPATGSGPRHGADDA
jgi:predicted TPR repeat methyltransferase